MHAYDGRAARSARKGTPSIDGLLGLPPGTW